MDARCVIVALMTCVAAVVLTPAGHPARLVGEGLLVLGALAAVRTPPIWLLKRALLLLPFMLLAIAPAAFAGMQGHATGSIPVGLALTRVGICFGALAATARMVEPHDLPDALSRLRVPAILTGVAALMLRYLGVLEGEARRMVRARDLRGRPARVRERARVAGAMVGSLLVRSMERAERVSQAMQSRGFAGALPAPAPAALPRLSILLLGLCALVQVLLLWLY